MSKAENQRRQDSRPAQSSSVQPLQKRPWPTLIVFAIAATAAAVFGTLGYLFSDIARTQIPGSGASPPAAFVGSEACAGCHQAEAKLWQTSQHKKAMDHAIDKSVLGDFSGATFTYYGVTSRFFRKDGKFFVETDGPDGKLATFEVKYTFGLDPLQQYLIEFPDGRLQALSIAWDSRPKQKGGQRWFHLYPNEQIHHDDILHWTKLNQNWNYMCAECHSTGVRKNYDAANDRFATSWAEISVGCEACHGQGARHVAWVRKQQSWWPFGKIEDRTKGLPVQFDERRDVVWQIEARTGIAARSAPRDALRKEVETCGLCHARRGQSSEEWVPGRWLSNTHAVASLTRELYHADGQDRDEVYNYGAFKQSKMFAAGVTCGDCHDPHSGMLRLSRDNVCLQCHGADKYTAVTHHRHESVNPALACASCHMPVRTYMVVDPRHDHSFRIPRPDLSAKLGLPNACNDCHANKTSEWAAAAIEAWHGPNRKGLQNYAEAFHAAWAGHPDAARLLAAVAADATAPAFARAGALVELAPHRSRVNLDLVRRGLADPDPMVRIGALDMLEGVPPDQQWPLVAPLLTDPVHGVRIRAVSSLAGIATSRLAPRDRETFERVTVEFIVAQQLNADRPEARSALGRFYTQRGRAELAETEYKAALRLSAQYVPAAINLADLYRQLGREDESESVLRTALMASPRDGGLHHARGLALARLKRLDEAIGELRTAAELEPDRARYAYVYAIALHSATRVADAIVALQQNLGRHPRDRDTLNGLISFHREAGDIGSAIKYAEQLAATVPEDQDLALLIIELRRQVEKPGAR